jgi:3-hydroxyacyl-[acyl-carrier-protein] dehydratase
MYGREVAVANVEAPPHGEASALTAVVRVRAQDPGGIETSFVVDAGEPVLAGHFPGYPILPGVCLVEAAHRAAALALAAQRPRLAGVENARFQSPVFAGDEVLVEVRVTADAGGWRCRARLTVDRGDGPVPAATVRLRYEPEERDAADS